MRIMMPAWRRARAVGRAPPGGTGATSAVRQQEQATSPGPLAVRMSRALPDTVRDPAIDVELRSIEAQLNSFVITDEYRAALEERRAAILAMAANTGPEADARAKLAALAREAGLRQEASAAGLSTGGPGPSDVTVPITALLTVPEPVDEKALFAELVRDPSGDRGRDLASRYVIWRYLSDKLGWQVRVHLFDPGGQVWFMFSVHGVELLASQTLELPVTALDIVSAEPLDTFVADATQLVEVATLEAAAPEIAAVIGERPEAMVASPQRFARSETVVLRRVVDRYLQRSETLIRTLRPQNAWLSGVLTARVAAVQPLAERVRRADQVTNAFHNENMPDTTYGETYDEAVEESSGVVERVGWKFWRGLGDTVTGGGQSLTAENARLYRRGEISLDDYRKNVIFNFGRVAVTAVVSALSGGRASGPAMRFLGLEAGTSAAAVVAAGGAEGVAGGFAQSFSSDLYAKVVASASTSPGVIRFHEQTIGGPSAWAESASLSGMMGMGGGLLGHVAATRLGPTQPDITPGGTGNRVTVTPQTRSVRVANPDLLARYEQLANERLPDIIDQTMAAERSTRARVRLARLGAEFDALRAQVGDAPSLTAQQRIRANDILREARRLARRDFGGLQGKVMRRLRADPALQAIENQLVAAGDAQLNPNGTLRIKVIRANGTEGFEPLNLEHRVRLSDNPWLAKQNRNILLTDAPQNQQYLEGLRQQGSVWPSDPVETFVVRHQLNDEGIDFSPATR
jgi:hypothetical protein